MVGFGHWVGHSFPYGTLVINIIGSLILGAVIEVIASTWLPSEALRSFLVIGFLGSFTTFSTFSLDAMTLIERGEFLSAASYIIASVVVSVAALFFGMIIFRHLLA
jgi:CrcB protein